MKKKEIEKEKDVQGRISALQEQTKELERQILAKQGESADLESKDLSENEYQQQHKALSDRVEELEKKKTELREKITVLELQKSIQEKISSSLPFISLAKGLLQENKELAAEIFGIFLDAALDMGEGIDAQLARGSKLFAKNSFRRFTDFQEAGFNREEAMTLLLATQIKISEVLHAASQKTSSLSESAKKIRTRKSPFDI